MDSANRTIVHEHASHRCEYCRIDQVADPLFRLDVEHIVSRQHGNSDDLSNIALWCGHYNRLKGPNLAAIDPETGQLTRLFNPRTDSWDEHFVLSSGTVRGQTRLAQRRRHSYT